jgi:hypothetical protein
MFGRQAVNERVDQVLLKTVRSLWMGNDFRLRFGQFAGFRVEPPQVRASADGGRSIRPKAGGCISVSVRARL